MQPSNDVQQLDWTTVAVVLGLLVPFMSGIVSVVISGALYRRHEERTARMGVLQRLTAGRNVLVSGRPARPDDEALFFGALNEIFVRFRSRPVRDRLSDLLTAVETKSNADAALLARFTAMCADLELPADEVAKRFFKKPFHYDSAGWPPSSPGRPDT